MYQMGRLVAAWAAFFSVVFFGCKSRTEFDFVPTELILNIRFAHPDDPSKILRGAKGAKVYLYEVADSANQLQSALTFSPGNFSDSATVLDTALNSGFVHFKNLKPGMSYFMNIYMKFEDPRYPGGFIYYDNSQSGYEFRYYLIERSISEGQVELFPAEGFVHFYSLRNTSGQPSNLPIRLTADIPGTPLSFLTTITSSVATNPRGLLTAPGVTTVKLRYGTYNIGYINQNGCSGFDTVEVRPGDVINFNVDRCNMSAVSFYTTNSAALPITVVLDVNNTLGGINTAFRGVPDPLNAPGTLYKNLPPGNYSYFAFSEKLNTAWNGSFTIGNVLTTIGIRLD